MIDGLNEKDRGDVKFALGMGADTGPSTGSGQPVAKASVV